MAQFAYAACVPFGRERTGLLFRAADAVAAPAGLLEQIEALLGLGRDAGLPLLHYDDDRRGQRRSVRLAGSGEATRIEALLLAGDTSAEAWVKPLLQDERPAQAYGRLLLLPGAAPPVAVADRGHQVCTCMDVRDREIDAELGRLAGDDESRLAALQTRLKCGTQCGSCLPSLRRMVRLHAVAA
jgi:assimilatory nitrate reductase catalytic subunit